MKSERKKMWLYIIGALVSCWVAFYSINFDHLVSATKYCYGFPLNFICEIYSCAEDQGPLKICSDFKKIVFYEKNFMVNTIFYFAIIISLLFGYSKLHQTLNVNKGK